MPPSAAGSAHFDAPKLSSGKASAFKSEDASVVSEMDITQRSINSSAEASSGHASLPGHLEVEVNKRRRIVHEPTLQRLSQQPLTRASFGSDSVKVLFDSELPAVTGAQVQPNRNASMPVSVMTMGAGPDIFRNIGSLAGSGGAVDQAEPRNALTALTSVSNNTGKRAALDSINVPEEISRGINVPVSGVSLMSHPMGFMIPGLGALVKPLGLDNSTKTSGVPQQTPHGSVNTSAPQMQQKCDGEAAYPPTALQSSLTKQDSSLADQVEKPKAQDLASSDAPVTLKKLQVSTSPSGIIRESEYIRPAGSPPVWREKQVARTFKLLRTQHNLRAFETFDGAYSILSGMNPDHFSMPHGSQVVAVKCPNVDDILMSHQTGFWTTNQNVMTRIMDLHNSREDPSMKTLFLWSMPGSKHFCGLSELQAFDPKVKTDVWDKETGKWNKLHGAMMIQWKYCKLVPYDEVIPLVEGKIDQGSITQMWNGMYYTEATGREVVKAYIEAPHIENLLAAPTTEFFRRAMENSRIATVPPMGPKTFGRGSHRGRGGYKSGRRATLENGKTDNRPQPSSVPGSATKYERKEVDHSTQTNATSPEHYRDRGKPELQVLPVLKYPDGSMTTAPDMDGKTVPVTRFDNLVNMQILRGERANSLTQAPVQSSRAARSNSLLQAQNIHTIQSSRAETHDSVAQNQGFRVEKLNSLAQTQGGHTLQSSNLNPISQNRTTLDTSFGSRDPVVQRKSSSVFNDAYRGSSYEMAPPPKPFATQHGPASNSEHHSFSTPRTMPDSSRFTSNVDTWSYGHTTPSRQVEPKTPVSQSRSLYELSTSPMETSPYATPTTHGVRLPSTPSRVESQGKSNYGFGQVPEKLRTPDSSPLAARMQLAQQMETPRPAFGLGHADHGQEEGNVQPRWVSMLVDHE